MAGLDAFGLLCLLINRPREVLFVGGRGGRVDGEGFSWL
jgi:hypothetical protein